MPRFSNYFVWHSGHILLGELTTFHYPLDPHRSAERARSRVFLVAEAGKAARQNHLIN
jgi:hypothetical protein